MRERESGVFQSSLSWRRSVRHADIAARLLDYAAALHRSGLCAADPEDVGEKLFFPTERNTRYARATLPLCLPAIETAGAAQLQLVRRMLELRRLRDSGAIVPGQDLARVGTPARFACDGWRLVEQYTTDGTIILEMTGIPDWVRRPCGTSHLSWHVEQPPWITRAQSAR